MEPRVWRASSLAMLAAFSPLLICMRWGGGALRSGGQGPAQLYIPSSHALPACTGQTLLLAFPTQGLDKKRNLALAFSPVFLQLFPLLLLTLGSGWPACKGQQLLVPSGLLG